MAKRELTETFCRTVKASDGKQLDFFDENTKGLCLRVSPGGTKTWQLFYTKPSDGKRSRMKLGRYPDIGLARAREKARENKAKLGDGQDPVAEKKAKAAAQTVADLVENYIERALVKNRSADDAARGLRKNVSDVIGAIKLADLHRRDLTGCIDRIVDRGSGIAANRVFAQVRAMVRWAHGRGDIENLVLGMKPPTEERVRERVLIDLKPNRPPSYAQIRTVWANLDDATMTEGARNILRLCLVTGQRVGEVAGMALDEIDLDEAIWVIPASRVKNGKKHGDHVLPLSAMAVRIIESQVKANRALAKRKERTPPKFIFPAPGGRAAMGGGAVAKAVKRQEKVDDAGATTILGVAPWTPHDLRRSAATGMEAIGISPFVIGHVLNHAGVTKASITSSIYARFDYAQQKREALDMWADQLAAIIEGKDNVVPLRGAVVA